MAYAVPPTGQPEVALFYQTGSEALGASATNVLGFSSGATYNSPIVTNSYTASPDQSIFTVNVSGLYQLEGHISVAPNGATWTAEGKSLYFTITRAGSGAIATVTTSTQALTGTSYSIALTGTYPLQQGDQIQLVHGQSGVTGNPLARGLENGFDLNTWVTFTFVKNV